MGKGFRCFSYALIGVALILIGTSTALAHTDPAGSTGTGVSVSMTAFRHDGTTPVLPGTVLQCESIVYRATIAWAGGSNAAIQGGTINITTPDLVVHNVTPAAGVPCLGGTDGVICDPTVTSINSQTVSFTAAVASCPATLTASVAYSNGTAHIGANDTIGVVSGGTSLPLGVTCCADNNACTTDSCDANGNSGAGACVFTPISCNDSNACTTDTCDVNNGCVHTPISCNDSNACTTDTCDVNNGCVHTPISCDDSNACTTDTCDANNGCVHTAISCDDSNACTTDTCDANNGCVHTAISCDDNNSCTDDSCDANNGCVHTPNTSCVTNEICRTPGFWGTHACPGGTQSSLGTCEKANSQNITQIVLDQLPGLTICGHPVNTTDLTDTSAVEAICVAIKGDSTLQVARQLTAAALNCIVSNSTGCGGAGQNATDPCTGVSVDAVFAACNDPANACAVTAVVGGTTVDCISALDCFNNGGDFDVATGTCSASTNSCHDRLLVNGCFNFEPPGPAGSPKECNDARKDAITIFN